MIRRTAVLTVVLFAAGLALAHPIYNPDLLWHLASAREALNAGTLTLTSDIFSYTLNGQAWINIGWLSQYIFWFIYSFGGFTALTLTRAAILVVVIALTVCRAAQMIRRDGHAPPFALNLAVLLLSFGFCLPRASVQAELFSLLFLPLYFSLRHRIMSSTRRHEIPLSPVTGGEGWGEGVRPCLLFAALFALWANLHGGFVWALVLLGIGMIGVCLDEAAAPSAGEPWLKRALSNHRFRVDAVLLAVGFAATLANPHGARIYEVIFIHLRQMAGISELILEWLPASFTSIGMPAFWLVYFASIGLWLYQRLSRRPADFESLITLLVFGWFVVAHQRAVALYGVVCVPIFARLAFAAARNLRAAPPQWPAGAYAWILAAALLLTPSLLSARHFVVRLNQFVTVHMSRMFTHEPYLQAGAFPVRSVEFIRSHPELHNRKLYIDWDAGGYAAFHLHELGIRTFYDGRYIFHDLLLRAVDAKSDPAAWNALLDQYGTDLALIPVPKQFYYVKDERTGEPVLRTWHTFAYPQTSWRVLWWDSQSVVLSRRRLDDSEWFTAHESPTRMIIDPFYNPPSAD